MTHFPHAAPSRRSDRLARVGAALLVVGSGLAAATFSVLLHGDASPAHEPAGSRQPVALEARSGAADAYTRYFGDRTLDELRRQALAGDPSAALALGRTLAERAADRDDLKLASTAAMWLDRARQQDEVAALDELTGLFSRFCHRPEMYDHPLCDLGE